MNKSRFIDDPSHVMVLHDFIPMKLRTYIYKKKNMYQYYCNHGDKNVVLVEFQMCGISISEIGSIHTFEIKDCKESSKWPLMFGRWRIFIYPSFNL